MHISKRPLVIIIFFYCIGIIIFSKLQVNLLVLFILVNILVILLLFLRKHKYIMDSLILCCFMLLGGLFTELKSKDSTIKCKKTYTFIQKNWQLRNKLSLIFEKLDNKNTKILLKSLILGKKEEMPWYIRMLFIKSGIWHMFVVSGWHIAALTFFIVFCLRLFIKNYKIRYLIVLPTIYFYLILTGAQPPAVRASFMASLIIFAKLINRDYDLYNILAFVGLVLLIYNPLYLFNLSFQLSYLATLGIIHIYSVFDLFKENKILNILIKAIGISISANLFILPVLIENFERVSTVSFITSCLLAPAIEILIVYGCILLVLGFIITQEMLNTFALPINLLVDNLIIFIKFITKFSFVYIKIPKLPVYCYLLYYISLGFLPYKKFFRLSLIILLLGVNIFLFLKLIK